MKISNNSAVQWMVEKAEKQLTGITVKTPNGVSPYSKKQLYKIDNFYGEVDNTGMFSAHVPDRMVYSVIDHMKKMNNGDITAKSWTENGYHFYFTHGSTRSTFGNVNLTFAKIGDEESWLAAEAKLVAAHVVEGSELVEY